MPRYAASRELLAPRDDVWAFLAEPHNLPDWWPGIAGVEPGRRGLTPGARWQTIGPNQPSYLRRPQMTGTLQVLAVEPYERFAFQLTGDRIEAEVSLAAVREDRTKVTVVVSGPWLIGLRRSFPQRALSRLYALVQTAADA
jgi:uncharacterized protein YndB with AHSA1/START domain